MFTKNDSYELKIKSVDTINMSNWQITYTIDTLTTVNNKFDILSKVNDLINNGISKKNIFITDKSFLISTNYKTYFEKGDTLENTSNAIIRIASIGRMITMEYNEDMAKINSLIAYYKSINSIMNMSMRCRLRGKYLSKSYSLLFKAGLEEAYECLTKGAQQQIKDIFGKYISPDNEKMNKLLTKIDNEKDRQYKRNNIQYEKMANEGAIRFESTFNRFDRPVLGVYDDINHSFKIINTDQMYKNGEESEKQIRLKTVTKNSPVVITLIVTGIMLSFIGYLVYRDHKVNNETVNAEMLNIPQNSNEVINNIFCNREGEIIDNNSVDKNVLDPQLIALIEKNFNKLESIASKRKVHMEINEGKI